MPCNKIAPPVEPVVMDASAQAAPRRDADLHPLPWMDVLDTGIAEIDSDHRSFIDQFHALTAMMANGAARERLEAALQRMLDGCLRHFEQEEAILRRARFPRYDAHVEAHRQFGRELRDLLERFAAAGEARREQIQIISKIGNLLVELLVRHDLDYKSHLLDCMGR